MALLRKLLLLCGIVGILLGVNVQAGVQGALAQEQLEQARQVNCSKDSALSALQAILCKGEIEIGVKGDYRFFGELNAGTYTGYEIDVAKVLAERLGVRAKLVQVTGADRIRRLLAGEIDMVLATMGHTVDRDGIVYFVRPQYYAAPTTIVGDKAKIIRGWDDLTGSVVCVPMANFSNIEFAKRKGQRVMIYSDPTRLTQALLFGACSLIAHDQTFVRAYLTGPQAPAETLARFDEKVSFFEIPWGIAVTKQAGASLGRWLELTSADMHQSGLFLQLATKHGVHNEFLLEQNKLWSQEPCRSLTVFDNTCLIPAGDNTDRPSPISAGFQAFNELLVKYSVKPVKFPMFTGDSALGWFLQGLNVTLILVAGALLATLSLGVVWLMLLRSKLLVIRFSSRLMLVFFQNSPVILLLILGYLAVSMIWAYTIPVSILSAVIVIGLNNGANLAASLYEVWLTSGKSQSLGATLRTTMVPLRAALINAAKATPVAGFIGVSDLLATLNDVTAYSGEQLTTFLVLTIVYLFLIQLVMVSVTKTTQFFVARSAQP